MHASHERRWYIARSPTWPGTLPPSSGQLLQRCCGTVACGTALGSDAFIAQHIQRRCDSTCAQVDQLVGLLLDPQTKWSVPHKCLQHREAHLMWNT